MNRSAAIITALLLCGALSQRVRCQTVSVEKNPDAIVSGRITIQGKPAPGIVVGLLRPQSQQRDALFKSTTDQDGKYRIANVPAGTYQIMPAAPAFVAADLNKSLSQSLVIGEGDDIAGIDFDLRRGAVITGKVTDGDGRPIVEESIHLSAADPRGSGAGLSRIFETDDRGIYRMFGIPPGRYKVSIGEESFGLSRGSRTRRSIPITYYPNTGEAAKAAVVELSEGTEATNIDISLSPPPRTFSVSGRVIDADSGKPTTKATINLSKITMTDASSWSASGGTTDARSNADGEFTLDGLPPGKYAISIQPPPESSLRTDSVRFDIVDDNVTGLIIKTTNGAIISGTVVLDRARNGNSAGPAPSWLSVYLRNDVQGTSYSSGHSTDVKPDGTFQIGGLTAGTVGFSAGAWSPTGDQKPIPVVRVERDGVVQTNGIQVQNGEHISGIRIVVAYSSGSIRGVVKLENGTLPANGYLVISLSRVGDNAPKGNGNSTDARGHFIIEGLASGTYEVTVTAYVPGLRRPVTTKQMVTVTDGAATDVLLTLDLSPPKSP